jgi:hypothetical protein
MRHWATCSRPTWSSDGHVRQSADVKCVGVCGGSVERGHASSASPTVARIRRAINRHRNHMALADIRPTRSWEQTAPPVGLGTKAEGLATLNAAWVPDWIGVGTDLAELIAEDEVAPTLYPAVSALVARSSGRRLLVRSDGSNEVAHPGQGLSVVCGASISDVLTALRSVVTAVQARPAALVQVAIEPGLVGMLSNERRLTSTPEDWIAEGDLELNGPRVLRLHASDSSDRTLSATSTAMLPAVLATIAGALTVAGVRRRVEWVWDGRRVWVVQADRLPDPHGAIKRTVRSIGQSDHTPVFGDLVGDTTFGGRKLERWRTLERVGLPRPRILVIDGRHATLLTTESGKLAQRLTELSPGAIVARTDVTPGHANELLLATSPPVDDPRRLRDFISQVARTFAEAGLHPDEWALLCATLIPCRASAMAHAEPGNEIVHVDAVLGYPDGLLHLPHDTFTIKATVTAEVRFKPACVLPDQSGWRLQPVSPPFDWRPALTNQEATIIAGWARRLALATGDVVQLMVLAGVDAQSGGAGLRAFHYTALHSPDVSARSWRPVGDCHVAHIRNPRDLAQLQRDRPRPRALRVRPAPEHLRDPAFLRQIGAWAADQDLPVLFAGSLLGHAFHLLASEGAVVVHDDTHTQPRQEKRTVVVNQTVAGLQRVMTIAQSVVDAHPVTASSTIASASGFPTLPRVAIDVDALGESAAGTIPLFMDDADHT